MARDTEIHSSPRNKYCFYRHSQRLVLSSIAEIKCLPQSTTPLTIYKYRENHNVLQNLDLEDQNHRKIYVL